MLSLILLLQAAQAGTTHYLATFDNPMIIRLPYDFSNGIVSYAIRLDERIETATLAERSRDRKGKCTEKGVRINIFETESIPGSVWLSVSVQGWAAADAEGGQCQLSLPDGSLVSVPYKIEVKPE